jgi:hypothetical protein
MKSNKPPLLANHEAQQYQTKTNNCKGKEKWQQYYITDQAAAAGTLDSSHLTIPAQ